ncbi:MAG: hypothetical protein E5W15_20745 [Mesorhizobium sp.]|nr:hypothetical protein EJ068_18750 [Mesorhizobium sp. M2A.F.Ca.ET.043.02.1.1]RUW43124.1 hypothetical protein EOA37_01955 [Mesorhizobium sp. M2A.F.Ca.ET.015.02.1.1]RUW68868.1 hypothetical protein EOA28_26475 [Mesorhizobium sp. M2A.F.Ca.ET.067.02.1.1]RVC97311.1 hypothetical protein EN739_05005 [Mesorhizobium sp. M2A.F.Ca.ET.017.03.2.1]RVD08957.1 hypothetical protein EN753_12120 [Mesorhizobium sp. M2A.F.Ca.ET.029.05.1.1]RWB41273.1 MAG: hypothetical protein EOQ46_21835 [Mesorhizobium sp.]
MSFLDADQAFPFPLIDFLSKLFGVFDSVHHDGSLQIGTRVRLALETRDAGNCSLAANGKRRTCRGRGARHNAALSSTAASERFQLVVAPRDYRIRAN